MIDFVILHYGAIDETIECIESISEKVKGEKRIIVVDNCSPDGSGKLLLKQYCGLGFVSIILAEKNLGFAKGNNLGFKEAKKDNPDFIVILNSDTLICQKNFTELLEKSYEKYSFDVLGPDIYSTKSHSHQNPQREENYSLAELKKMRKKLLLKNHMKWAIWIKYRIPYERKKFWQEKKEFSVPQTGKVLHGAFYIFSRKYIQKHRECFYNGTFMYFESYILHYLGMQEGLIFQYDPDIKILHHEDVSTDNAYRTQYRKSLFVNKCMLESCDEFIRVIENRINYK